jgi:hypothetical protein
MDFTEIMRISTVLWPAAALVLVVVSGAIVLHPASRQWLADATAPFRHGYHVQRNVMVPMRDGTRLAMDIHIPAGRQPPLPTIYIQTPYGGIWAGDNRDLLRHFPARGFVLAVQHVRGRYASEGVFTVTRDLANDSADTVDWLIAQPWSNGRVGTFGCSYLGESQIALARNRHPAHRAIIAQGAGGAIGSARGSYRYFGVFEGGILNLASAYGWFKDQGDKHRSIPARPDPDPPDGIRHLPVIEALQRVKSQPTDFEYFASHALVDPWWEEMGYVTDQDRFSTPGLHVNGWFDQTVSDTILLAQIMREHATTDAGRHQYVIIGPGNHCQDEARHEKVGELPVSNAEYPYFEIYDRWLDYWLADSPEGLPELAPYNIFVLGANEWRQFDQWPPSEVVPQHLYLRAGARLSDARPNSSEGSDSYRYDPMDPVPTLGGSVCCTGDPPLASGFFDQRPLEQRDDILVYTSSPLDAPLTVAGQAELDLYVSSSAPDTDFMAKLIDVWPDGRAFNVRDSAIRARYRNGYANPEPLIHGERHRVVITLPPVAYRFREGHSIRVHVTSSNFPRFERNLNTGGPNFSEGSWQPALNTVFHDEVSPSRLTLPILPDSGR